MEYLKGMKPGRHWGTQFGFIGSSKGASIWGNGWASVFNMDEPMGDTFDVVPVNKNGRYSVTFIEDRIKQKPIMIGG